jgi:hypothetical protein
VLYIPCFTGELGWELINYVPYVNYIVSQSVFDEIFVATRPGREALYPMATTFYNVDVPTEQSTGNRGCNRGAPIEFDTTMIRKLESDKNVDVHVINQGEAKPKTYGLAKNRKFMRYSSSTAAIEKWKSVVNKKCIILCIRSRLLSPVKNWPNRNWMALKDIISGLGYVPVFTGTNESTELSKAKECINLIGKTSMEDMIAIFSLGRLAAGQSTGTMHLASLCGTPHVVWGPDRIKERYIKSWNPLRTPAVYYAGGGNQAKQSGFACSIKTVKKMVARMLKGIK